jgi:signal transduction histidine kinase
MHKLLHRQLRQSRENGELDTAVLLELVDAAYHEIDRERRFTAHAYQVMRDEQRLLAQRQMKTHEMMARIRAEKAEAESARAVAEAELLKRERLSVLGQLTATVAHELRNPLSAIRNSVYAMRELSAGANQMLDRPMTRIDRAINRCDGIIGDLLEYARARVLETAPIALDGWLADVLDDQAVPDGIRLERRFAAAGAVVAIDPDRFRRVINNLVENAMQALVERGRDAAARRVTVATSQAERTEIAIADTGPGIPPEILPRIFEPLFSTKSFGTGLGLPTVKQIVEQHQGTITVSSMLGEGTLVSLSLPTVAAAASYAAMSA